MKNKLTNLKKDTHFLYNNEQYKKISDYNKSGECLSDNGDIVVLPLMSVVEVVEKKRKKSKKNEDNSEKVDSDGLRDGRIGPVELQPDPISGNSSGPEATGDSAGFGV